jgi:hypothetical protein
MDVETLKAKLAALDEDIKTARLARDNANSDLELAVAKRRNFASINCDHKQGQRYERGYGEVDIHCGVCDLEVGWR